MSGALPPQLAAMMQSNVNVQSLTVEAALTGKREHVYHAAMLDPHTAAVEKLVSTANERGVKAPATLDADDRDGWLDLLFSHLIQPQLGSDRLCFVNNYPASQAALARLCPADDRVADRFEVFCGDLELANGYVELTDAAEQQQRIEADIAAREQTGRSSLLADESLLAALDAGLPPCAGVAVGMERLHMVLDQADDIRDVITFATETS